MKALSLVLIALFCSQAFANPNLGKLELKLRSACRGELDGFGATKICQSTENSNRYWVFARGTTGGYLPRHDFLKLIEIEGKKCNEVLELTNANRETSSELKNQSIFSTIKGDLKVVLNKEETKFYLVGQDNKILEDNNETVKCVK